MDLGVATGLVELLEGGGGGHAEEDVLADGALEEGAFLGDEGDLLAVFRGVEVGEGDVVYEDSPLLEGIEGF